MVLRASNRGNAYGSVAEEGIYVQGDLCDALNDVLRSEIWTSGRDLRGRQVGSRTF